MTIEDKENKDENAKLEDVAQSEHKISSTIVYGRILDGNLRRRVG